jgi:hypothetical protein
MSSRQTIEFDQSMANQPVRGSEFITYEKGNEDAWVCICGNQPHHHGFYPCDEAGNEVEPVTGWEGLYVCAKCGRIIQKDTLEVIGQNPNFKLL